MNASRSLFIPVILGTARMGRTRFSFSLEGTSVGMLISWSLGLVAEACNHPNCLVLPFRLELIRLAA